jgi:hypothetical protein
MDHAPGGCRAAPSHGAYHRPTDTTGQADGLPARKRTGAASPRGCGRCSGTKVTEGGRRVSARSCSRDRRRAMYSLAAEAVRRCTARRKDGEPCRAWALWRYADQLCIRHSGLWQPTRRGWDVSRMHARYEPCDCPAYSWRHRPGGGLCRWPLEPEDVCQTPVGSHRRPRLRRPRVSRRLWGFGEV